MIIVVLIRTEVDSFSDNKGLQLCVESKSYGVWMICSYVDRFKSLTNQLPPFKPGIPDLMLGLIILSAFL